MVFDLKKGEKPGGVYEPNACKGIAGSGGFIVLLADGDGGNK